MGREVEETDPPQPLDVRTTYDLKEEMGESLGLRHAQLRGSAHACALCGGQNDVAAVAANPFAQCPLALVCATCRHTQH